MHDEMKKPELSEICQIEKDLISTLKTVVAHGVFSKDVDAKELGELVDMVKDLAETKRNCWEACYYETVTMAMKEYDEDENEDVMGYNRNRYKSGRYAPAGMGDNTSGYTPYFKRMPIPMRPGTIYHDGGMMGYSGDRDQNGDTSNNSRGSGSRNGSYGYPYDERMNDNMYGTAFKEYENAKRHYTESKSLEDKTYMDDKAMEHVDHSMKTLREIWKNADPTVKKEVSTAITTLASEFKSV